MLIKAYHATFNFAPTQMLTLSEKPKILCFKTKNTKKLDDFIKAHCHSIFKSQSLENKIEISYQEIEKSRENPNPLMLQRVALFYYHQMVDCLSKMKVIRSEHLFMLKYAYIRGLSASLHEPNFILKSEFVIGQPLHLHLLIKFRELKEIWDELSPLLQMLYHENLSDILKQCLEFNKSITTTLKR